MSGRGSGTKNMIYNTSSMFTELPTSTKPDSSYICSRQAHKRMKICRLFPRNMFTTIIDFYELKTAKSLMYNKSEIQIFISITSITMFILIYFPFLFSGAYLEQMYDESVVVAVATIVAILDVLFIIFMVPESLPDKCKPSKSLTLDQVDPFSAMKKIWKDKTILMICLTVFLSYLPEAGQYSCFFVYLR